MINIGDCYTDGKCKYRILSVNYEKVYYETATGHKETVSRRTFDEMLEPSRSMPFRLERINDWEFGHK